MRRHELDPVALVAGLVTVLVGVGYFIGRSAAVDVEGWLVVAGVLIALGLLGFIASCVQMVRAVRRRAPTDASVPAGAPSSEEP